MGGAVEPPELVLVVEVLRHQERHLPVAALMLHRSNSLFSLQLLNCFANAFRINAVRLVDVSGQKRIV